jgi:hypothetical protein
MNSSISNNAKFETKKLLRNIPIVYWDDDWCFVNKELPATLGDNTNLKLTAKSKQKK